MRMLHVYIMKFHAVETAWMQLKDTSIIGNSLRPEMSMVNVSVYDIIDFLSEADIGWFRLS